MSAVKRRARTEEPTVAGLRIGLRAAEDLLEDGGQTIYRPGYREEEGMLVVGRSASDAAMAS